LADPAAHTCRQAVTAAWPGPTRLMPGERLS
jgi:hypothetical protein